MRGWCAGALLAALLALLALPAAHAGLTQDVELDNAGAVRRAIQSGAATPDSRLLDAGYGEPGIPLIALAARAGAAEVVRLLVALKADLNALTPVGETALMLASFVPDPASDSGLRAKPVQLEIVRTLVEAGALLDNPGRMTAVSYAAYAGQLEILRYLLDRKASPDGGATGEQSDYPTPLMMAVMQRKKDAARLLLERGANPRIRNPVGADALALAQKQGRPELVPLLECAAALAPGQSFADACGGK
jgi:ankyrin repeat protein